jgi:hypothetical protein
MPKRIAHHDDPTNRGQAKPNNILKLIAPSGVDELTVVQ